uniref:Aminoglycoside phosphotransferase domain-containing protein n=1 Tax=viral metagenome TaxID=1070528 RepID=A0A6C0DVN1_9ZZZZ
MRRVRRTRKRGGRRLGQGVEGEVYTPPLRCSGVADVEWQSPDYVSKVTDAAGVEQEYKASYLIRQLDPAGDWSIHAEQRCAILPKQANANYRTAADRLEQLIFRNGGASLLDYLLDQSGRSEHFQFYIQGITEAGDPDPRAYTYLNYSHLTTVIELVKRLLPKIDLLNSIYLHGDLHLGNIVYDGDRPRIIDFAGLSPIDAEVERANSVWSELGVDALVKGHPQQMNLIDEATRDKAAARDLATLFHNILTILASKWVQAESGGRYDEWVKKYRDPTILHFRSDFKVAIMEIPA